MGDIITERNGNARAFWRGIGTNRIQARRGKGLHPLRAPWFLIG
jgi:hypothetical protein